MLAASRLAAVPWIAPLLRSAPRVYRQPGVQITGQNELAVVWTTHERTAASVRVSKSPTMEPYKLVAARTRELAAQDTSLGSTLYQHEAPLSQLEPDTRYYYRIGADGSDLTTDVPATALSFRSAPRGAPFRFLVVGDSGADTPGHRNIAARMEAEPNVSLVLHTGDIVYPFGSFSGYQDRYFGAYRNQMAGIPFVPCLGNHDVEKDDGKAYLAMNTLPIERVPETEFGRYYSLDWGEVHFISLDSNLLSDPTRRAAMLRWLERDLALTRKAWKVAIWHHTAYDQARGRDIEATASRDFIVPLLDKYGVQVVFMGHHHAYARTHPARGGERVEPGTGTVYVTSGGGGAGLYVGQPHPLYAREAAEHHYVSADLRSNQMTIRAIREDGSEIDSFTIAPRPVLSSSPVVNAATFERSICAGAVISIFGENLAFEESSAGTIPLPRQLAGVRVTLDGRDLPLYFVSSRQINAQVFTDFAGEGVLEVITRNGSAQLSLTAQDTAPGIFVLDGTGRSPAILHAIGTPVSDKDPIFRGEVVSIFMTGLGKLKTGLGAGQLTPVGTLIEAAASVTVEIGQTVLQPLFAGLAPGLVGLYQVNVRVPTGTRPGEYVLRVRAGNAVSNAVIVSVS